MRDLLLLFMIRLHLINLVLPLCLDIRGIISGIIHQLLLHRQIHDIRAHTIHKILRVRRQHQYMVIRRQVRLQPDHGPQIQVIRRFIQYKQMRLDEKRTGEGYAHAPPTTHIFRGFLHHGLGESQSVEDASCLGLEGAWVELFELLVSGLESELIDVICNGELFDPGFEFGYLGFGRGDDEIEGVHCGRLGFAADEIDVNVGWDFNISLCDRSEECGLLEIVNSFISESEGAETDLSRAVLAEKPIPLPVVERNLGTFDK